MRSREKRMSGTGSRQNVWTVWDLNYECLRQRILFVSRRSLFPFPLLFRTVHSLVPFGLARGRSFLFPVRQIRARLFHFFVPRTRLHVFYEFIADAKRYLTALAPPVAVRRVSGWYGWRTH